jgi:hypothetical protein
MSEGTSRPGGVPIVLYHNPSHLLPLVLSIPRKFGAHDEPMAGMVPP